MKKFTLYEEVKVNSSKKNLEEINGKLAVIVSDPSTEPDDEYLTVFVLKDEECWCVSKHDLDSTNRFYKHEDFYDGSSIKVKVDEKGRGEILE